MRAAAALSEPGRCGLSLDALRLAVSRNGERRREHVRSDGAVEISRLERREDLVVSAERPPAKAARFGREFTVCGSRDCGVLGTLGLGVQRRCPPRTSSVCFEIASYRS